MSKPWGDQHTTAFEGPLRTPHVQSPLAADYPPNIAQTLSDGHSDSLESGHILLPLQLADHEHAAYDWFADMLSCKFFTPCQRHVDVRKNECVFFCKDCCAPGICQNCLPEHPQDHKLIQIRKYIYCYVVRVQDIQEHFDTAGVPAFTNNAAKVVFLQPHSDHAKVGEPSCWTCKDRIREGYHYCSLSCKRAALLDGTVSHDTTGRPTRPDINRRRRSLLLNGMHPPLKRPRHLRLSTLVCPLATSPPAVTGTADGDDERSVSCCPAYWKRRKQLSPQRSPCA